MKRITVMLEASESASFKLFRFDDGRRCKVSSTGLKIKMQHTKI